MGMVQQTAVMSVNDYYHNIQEMQDRYEAEIERLHNEIAEWKQMYIDKIKGA